MKETVWPKPEMECKLEEYGREITPCHPTSTEYSMHKELDKYDHLTRTEDKPCRLHLCGNGATTVHCCANPDHIKIGTNKENQNMPDAQSEEKRRKLREARKKQVSPMKGKTHSPETREKIRKALKGKTFSVKAKQKMREAAKGRKYKKVTCPHCGEIGGSNVMHRWHFDNCKSLSKDS